MSRKLLVVLVVLALMALPVTAMAGRGGDYNKDVQISMNMDATMQMMAYANMAWEKYSVDVNLNVTSEIPLFVEGLVEAVAKNDQYPEKNFTFNYEADNNATVAGSSLANFEGNLGLNVAAGNSNAQSNIAVYAAGEADASLTRATIFSVQKAMNNMTKNEGSANNASIDSNVLDGATGNVGLNVAAGNNNAQTNLTSIAVAPAKVGMALAYVQQKSLNNMTCNGPSMEQVVEEVPVNLTLSGSASFKNDNNPIGIVTSYQADNFYLDSWSGATHPAGTSTGHLDMDSNIQGAINNPYHVGEIGAGDLPIGGIAFETALPDAALSGTVSGVIPVVISMVSKNTVNNATISANTLSNLTGNFGINVAAGNNNMQANAFAACYVPAVSNGTLPPNGNGETN